MKYVEVLYIEEGASVVVVPAGVAVEEDDES